MMRLFLQPDDGPEMPEGNAFLDDFGVEVVQVHSDGQVDVDSTCRMRDLVEIIRRVLRHRYATNAQYQEEAGKWFDAFKALKLEHTALLDTHAKALGEIHRRGEILEAYGITDPRTIRSAVDATGGDGRQGTPR